MWLFKPNQFKGFLRARDLNLLHTGKIKELANQPEKISVRNYDDERTP